MLAAPEGAGVFVLMRVPDDLPATVIWAQSSSDLRQRLTELVEQPPPRLARYIERGQLHFRAAEVDDEKHRRQVLSAILNQAVAWDSVD